MDVKALRSKLFSFLPLSFKHRIYAFLRIIYDYSRLGVEVLLINSRRVAPPIMTCHMLVCKRREYVAISKFAIASFLRFNSNYKILLHSDREQLQNAKKLSVLFPGSRFNVIHDIPDSGYPYELKGQLLLSLQGTHDIYLDVDTRTNGSLPNISAPLTLVAEFKMKDNINFSRILRELDLSHFENCYLLNVSIVSWAGHDFGISGDEFSVWCRKYMQIDWNSFLSSEQIPYFKRFVEQVFMSIKMQERGFQVLKEKDRVGDKGLIECSYFGASGYRFGR